MDSEGERGRIQSLLEWRQKSIKSDIETLCPITTDKIEDATMQVFEQMCSISDEEHVLYPVLVLSVLRTLKEVLVDPNIWAYPCCDEEGKPLNFQQMNKEEAFSLRIPPAFDLQCMEFAEAEHHHGYSCKNSIHFGDIEKNLQETDKDNVRDNLSV